MRRLAALTVFVLVIAAATTAYAVEAHCYVNHTYGYIFCFISGQGSGFECDEACDSAVIDAEADCQDLPQEMISGCLSSANAAFIDCVGQCIPEV